MGDTGDEAQSRQEIALREAMDRHRSKPHPTGNGTDVCVSCGEPIDAARRHVAPAANTCTTCATDLARGKR